ncbi:MAG TPA: delta-60 repeat domain-containing protein [Blastocatellia bacterium]|nr:delta-60 repeat domain-containing protein [Blastocatellia bacterium]
MRSLFQSAEPHTKLAGGRARAQVMVSATLVFLLMAMIALPVQPGRAATNDVSFLDPTFGSGGKVTTDFFADLDVIEDMTIQPDGRIVVAGDVYSPQTSFDLAVARYNANGTLDATFGSGGKVTLDFFGREDDGIAIAVQRDGKLVVAGLTFDAQDALLASPDARSQSSLVVARFNANGALDLSFGGGRGWVVAEFGGSSYANDVAIQSDGRIVVVGHATSNRNAPRIGSATDMLIARYNSDGSPDTTFGGIGRVFTDFSEGNDSANSVALQADGRIVVAGSTSGKFALARYNNDGSLDSSFGSGGKLTNDFMSAGGSAASVAIQADGRIIAAGTSGSSFALARYNANGALDATFGSGGKVLANFGGTSVGYDLALQRDGRLILGGYVTRATGTDFAVARLNANGSFDTTFGAGGIVTADFFSKNDFAYAVGIQCDGRIVVAGSDSKTDEGDFALIRINPFDYCVQDDSNGTVLLVSVNSGDYLFFDLRKNVSLYGRGQITVNSCKITLTDAGPTPKQPDRSVQALVNPCMRTGSASVQIYATGATYSIFDSDFSNSVCACAH